MYIVSFPLEDTLNQIKCSELTGRKGKSILLKDHQETDFERQGIEHGTLLAVTHTQQHLHRTECTRAENTMYTCSPSNTQPCELCR